MITVSFQRRIIQIIILNLYCKLSILFGALLYRPYIPIGKNKSASLSSSLIVLIFYRNNSERIGNEIKLEG